jgi:hypothetical protein
MALRHLLMRISPRLDRSWVFGAALIGVLVLAAVFIRWSGPAPPIVLLALGPEGEFRDTVRLPREWADTATRTPDAVARYPIILGARTLGRRAVSPERLSLSVPVRYRLTGPRGGELPVRSEPGSPLITYTLSPELGALEPERLPTMLPAHDTLWLEVVIPAFYCVAVGDSIPEFVPAPPPALGPLSRVRLFYSFEGGDLQDRRTGTLVVGLDTAALARTPPPELPTFPMAIDPGLAQPGLGSLERVGARRSACGEPETGMEILSTVWQTGSGGRFITLDYGGTVRKRLYDLDGDGVIERESWAPDGDEFTATRRARLPIPEFLLPVRPVPFDMARFDGLPADSLARLDPLRRAMEGPGPVPGGRWGPGADSAARALMDAAPEGEAPTAAAPADSLPSLEGLPEPEIRPAGPLGQPVPADTVPPDTSG